MKTHPTRPAALVAVGGALVAVAACTPDAPLGANATAGSSTSASSEAAGGAGGGAGGHGGTSTTTGAGGAAPCPPGRTRCGDACVDLDRDAQHCGACDRACLGADTCSFGLCGVACTKTLGFPEDPLPATGQRPTDVVLLDLDHDGKLDLATLDQGSGGVRVRLGLGDGTFGAAVDSQAWSNPTSVLQADHFAWGDIDGDGEIDAVLTHRDSDEIVVLLGHGDGTFAASIATSVTRPSQIAVGDLDGDGLLDVVTISEDSGHFTVLRGHGDGTFAALASLPTGTAPGNNIPEGLAVADVDGDGALDVVISNQSKQLTTRLGNGDGSFQAPLVSPLGDSGYELTLGDVDGDGVLDALVVVQDMWLDVHVLAGKGDGTFALIDTLEYTDSRRPALADVDGDGVPDLITIDSAYDSFFVRRGLGAGMFDAPVGYSARGEAFAVAVGDLDGDGHADVVTSVGDFNVVGVSLNRGDATFGDPSSSLDYQYDLDIVSADLNGDGKLDLCVTRNDDQPGGPPRLDVYLGDGHGGFGAPVGDNPLGTEQERVVQTLLVDVDGDGRADVVTLGSFVPNGTNMAQETVRVRPGAGDGTFGAPISTLLTSYSVGSMAIVDVDGDGILDVVVPGSQHTELHLGLGDGSFGPDLPIAPNLHAFALVAGDWDGDGIVDLAVSASNAADVVVLRGNGDGTFVATQTFNVPTVEQGGTWLAAGDMNADGIPDLVVAAVSDFDASVTLVRLGKGDGTFGPPTQPPLSTGGGRRLTLADVDGDGNLDVLFYGAASSAIFVLRGAGDGALLPIAIYPSPPDLWGFTVGDMDGDGSRDVVTIGNLGAPKLLTNACLP